MLIVLTGNLERHAGLLEQLREQALSVQCFTTVPEIQQWLEVNHEPSGLIVDCLDRRFENFLIRFTLQHTDIPTLLLTDQPEPQQRLRLRAFTSRVALQESTGGYGRILFVDDSNTVRSTYRKTLEGDGFTVDIAENARSGLEMALHGNYDLAIIDYYMPDHSGAELCRQMGEHEETSELVRAILTAQYNPKIVDECLRAGARECMFKNESKGLFLSRVRALHRSVQRRIQVDQERTRLIGLLHSVPEGVYGVTPEGSIQFVNPATVKLLGRSVVDLLGRRPHECVHPVDAGGQPTTEDLCFLQQAYLLEDELREWRTLFTRADGSLFLVECNVTPLGGEGRNEGSVVVFRDISEQQRLEQNWQWQLNHDHLTGLLNRTAFEELLQRDISYLKRQQRAKHSSLLLFIDLDKFKHINDELGHAAGDQLLITLAEQLKSHARESDHLSRLAGDEFAILLTGVERNKALSLMEKYRTIFEQTCLDWEGQQYQITGSIGGLLLDETVESLTDSLAKADNACQQAKQKGRNQCVLYTESQDLPSLQGDWQLRLQTALSESRFMLLSQPIFSTHEQIHAAGEECFARLVEGNALLTPSLFMSKAQRYGLAADIDNWVIQRLITHCKSSPLPPRHWVGLNLSIDSIAEEDFVERLATLWQTTDLLPACLTVEISESELFKLPTWKKRLLELKKAGFNIALDHFGMNTNSLLNLPHLPVDMIKLDSSLTRTLATDIAPRHLIDAIVATARQSGITTVACHIESATELDLVQARGVDLVQGYLFAKPSPLGE